MTILAITAFGIGGATILGTLLGFLCKNISHRFSDTILAFAAGVMLSAAILGLIMPSITDKSAVGLFISISGIFAGAACISLIDWLVPHIHRMLGWENDIEQRQLHTEKLLLFIAAMAIHNFPEGLAAGVSFGLDDRATALMIAGGIALQNIPEGLVTVAPMLAAGIPGRKTFLCGFGTGIIEIIGTFIGYFAVNAAAKLLPFCLAFAGGTMLYVVSDEMIPETHDHGDERISTYALLAGFCTMLISDVLLR